MAVVYKARQLQPRRLVALKMILAGAHAGADAAARFHREAEALARLSHPGIVPVHQVGTLAGRPFLVLEYVEGGSLARCLGERQLSFREAACVVRQLARAVAHAHQRGILHRDLKPANVLLTAAVAGADDACPWTAKITDFGLAKLLDPATGQAANAQTHSGAVIGTPGYMAPEQAGSKRKDIGPATDVWALGAILYECLTGRAPFKAASVIDTLLQVAQEEPPRPTKLRAGCPQELELICLKCLEKDTKKRYPGAQHLADDLGRFLAGECIQPRLRRPLRGLVRLVRRHREVAFLVAGAAVALVVIGLVLGLSGRREQQAPAVQTPIRPAQAPDEPGESEMFRMLRRTQQGERLRELAAALRNYHKTKGSFPSAVITDPKTGKALLSWRVAMLPYLDQERLYREFKLDEAWDSPQNLRLRERIPAVFQGPGLSRQGCTVYQVLVGPGTAFEAGPGGAGRALGEFTDGTGCTILVAEAAEPVEWTRPVDLVYDPNGPLPRLGGLFPKTFGVALADGSVWEVGRDTAETTLRALITRNGGESLPPSWYYANELEMPQIHQEGTVSGRVTVEGQPCPGAVVRLHRSADLQEVVWVSQASADGTYAVNGISPEKYRISVTSQAGTKVSLPARYADPARSGLEVEVHSGKQTFNLELPTSKDKGGPGVPP
jgi:hypothetical protein